MATGYFAIRDRRRCQRCPSVFCSTHTLEKTPASFFAMPRKAALTRLFLVAKRSKRVSKPVDDAKTSMASRTRPERAFREARNPSF
jgi:hypothetical protein